jgi:ribA/ribD-fused uncharacterized protein
MRTTDEFVFFWGNQDIYSNFYPETFVHDEIRFDWAEQAVMYRKAMLFGAKDVAREILMATSAMQCKSLGRSRRIPFDENVWRRNRERIYREVLMDKFSLPHLKKQLLATGNRRMVEASPTDTIWGIGLHENHKDAENPTKWRGSNLLGKVLTQVRENLKEG